LYLSEFNEYESLLFSEFTSPWAFFLPTNFNGIWDSIASASSGSQTSTSSGAGIFLNRATTAVDQTSIKINLPVKDKHNQN